MKLNLKSKVFLLVIILVLSMISPVFAEDSNFDLEAFESGTVPNSVSSLTENSFGTAISIVRTAGLGIAVVILMVVAMKYMMAAPGDRADIKKHAVPFVIGAVVLFGTTGIISIIANVASTISLGAVS